MPGLQYMKPLAPKLQTRVDIEPLIHWSYGAAVDCDGSGTISSVSQHWRVHVGCVRENLSGRRALATVSQGN
jgi:hypothetical protein